MCTIIIFFMVRGICSRRRLVALPLFACMRGSIKFRARLVSGESFVFGMVSL